MKVQNYLPYIACAGVAASVATTAGCTLKAEKILGEKNLKDAPVEEKVKATWKYYIPVAAVAGATIVCILATKRLNAKELASVTAACTMLASKKSAIEKEIEKRYGKDAAEDIRKTVDKTWKSQTIEDTGKGKLLCIEGYSGRLFWSSEEAVKKAIDDFNYLYRRDQYVCLNDFYELLGIETSHFGHQYGWVYNSDYYDEEPLNIQAEVVEDKDRGCNICCIDVYTYPMECWQEV